MLDDEKIKGELFDSWPDRYDEWFETPIGALVKKYESQLTLDLLEPKPGEMILDAGCGTGVFTLDMLAFGPFIVGLDISVPMLALAEKKIKRHHFASVAGDMVALPFADNTFDKVVSITALEFIENGEKGVSELFRVTQKGGIIVVATLNSQGPWAVRRKQDAQKGDSIFEKAIFRSPDDMRSLAPDDAIVKTAIHFQKEDDPKAAEKIENDGWRQDLLTGAFVAARWEKC